MSSAPNLSPPDFGLTTQEAAFLSYLLERPGMFRTKREIIAAITEDPISRLQLKLVDVVACRVRQKLLSADAPHALHSCWGLGYAATNGFAPPPTSGTRWVPSRRVDLLHAFRQIEESTDVFPDAEARGLATDSLLDAHPEVTENVLADWEELHRNHPLLRREPAPRTP